jgi:FkbM family methyltransferase
MQLLRYRLEKGLQLLPFFLTRPNRIPLLFKGVSPGRLVALDVAWIQQAKIRTVIDIGANVGQFASAVHHLLPEASIYSFEPLAECYGAMTQRMANVGNFHGYQVALGNDDAVIDFNRNAFSQSSSVLPMAKLHRDAFTWSAQSETVKVEMRRLDDFAGEMRLAPELLIKIDVQGYEDRVLLGGERTIKSARYVITETSMASLYEGQASFERVYEIMSDYGFQYAGNMDQLQSTIDDRVLQADALFVRREG